MKAMLLEKTGPVSGSSLTGKDLPDPAPGPGEISVKINACAVCRTDLHIVEGDLDLPGLPVIPGHQIVGRVLAVGNGVDRYSEGARVGIAWLNSTCGHCKFCRSGRENLCHDARFTGFHTDGGYAEEMIVPADFAYPVPDDLPDIQAAPLLCAGIIGYRALKLSGIESGGRLGLYGFGASAHVTIQLARHAGCEVYVFSRGAEHRELAEELGAVWTGGPGDRPNTKLDASIIFAPAGELVLPALEALDRSGALVLAGIHMSPVPELKYEKHLYYERSIRSVTASTRQDGEELLNMASEIPIRTQTQPFSLAEANLALTLLKEGKINGAGVLVP